MDPLSVTPIQMLRAAQVTIRRIMQQGRAARMRFCVPVSFAAATIFMAFVIFRVFFTESIFRLMD
jgi:hypothetical protein